MTTQWVHNEQVKQVADEYRQKGYLVSVEPGGSDLPDFLQGFRPDIIAEGTDESVVVEVKNRATSNGGRWEELAQVIRQNPGWRLELVTGQREIPQQPLSMEEARDRLGRAERLLRTEADTDVALLSVWAALEAIMRDVCEQHRIELPDTRSGTLVTKLYTGSIIEREDYDLLQQGMQWRNAVAHGFHWNEGSKKLARQLRQLALRLTES